MKEKRFYLISLIATYGYLREKYNKVEDGVSKHLDEDIDNIVSLIQPLEKFVVIPDKADFVRQAISEIDSFCRDNTCGTETLFIQKIKTYSEPLNKVEKEEIINILIYVTDEDKNISDIEKEVILQVANSFGIEDNYDTLLKKYKKIFLKKPFSMQQILIPLLSMFVVVSGFLYFMSKKVSSNVQIFKDKKVVFNEISFNRFVIYKNKYADDSKHFGKQAVFYIGGKAEVSFDPDNIEYNSLTKTVTYFYPADAPYGVEMCKVTSQLVDEIKPQPISAEDAAKIATGIGIAGGILGAKAGSALGSLYPSPLSKIGGGVVGGAVGSIGAGLVSFKALNGLKVSSDISLKEKDLVVLKSKELINTVLSFEDELTTAYKQSFKEYIVRKYAQYNLEVGNVEFDSTRVQK